MKRVFLQLLMVIASLTVMAQRTFQHPGITYTEADIQRMKAFIEVKEQPQYRTFEALRTSNHVTRSVPSDIITSINGDDYYNGELGLPGRSALDNALLWKLTGNTAYANKAVAWLNNRSHITTLSASTAALSIGKVNLLIEAAELMRDYDGWAEADQTRFKQMLVNVFYPKLKSFDRARFGNQGLFAVRAIMAMAIYLDDEAKYDHAYRYITCQTRSSIDPDPYPLGAPTKRSETSRTEYEVTYGNPTAYGNEEYFYDEALPYYIYENGQNQESSRDQGHSLCGISMYTNIAEMAWNQGDDLYGALDSRILLGWEWALRYNHSQIEGTPWEPSGYTEGTDATFANEKYIQRRSRSTRWKSLKPNPDGRGDAYTNGLMREAALAHYSVRAGMESGRYEWLQKSVDRMIEKYGFEAHGKTYNSDGSKGDDNWYYEFPGYGTLTKRRGVWQCGDPVVSGKYQMHKVDETINCADVDRYQTADAEGHTVSGTIEYDGNALSSMSKDAWVSYTIFINETKDYSVILEYDAPQQTSISVAFDGGEYHQVQLSSSSVKSLVMENTRLTAGLHVIRIRKDDAQALRLKSLTLTAQVPTVFNLTTGDFHANIEEAIENAPDGSTLELRASQVVSKRLDVNKNLVINAGADDVAIVRDKDFNNGILILSSSSSCNLTIDGVDLDGNGVACSSTLVEAGNSGKITLKNLAVKNSYNTTGSGITNPVVLIAKGGGRLTLEDVRFDNNKAGNAMVFNGSSVALKGDISFTDCAGHDFYLEQFLSVAHDDMKWSIPLNLYYGRTITSGSTIAVGGSTWDNSFFNCANEGYRLTTKSGNGDIVIVEAPTFMTTDDVPFATFCVDYDARIPDGVKAYKATSQNATNIFFSEIEDAIPAGTGVLMEAESGTYTLQTAKTATAVTNNILLGTTTEAVAPDNCYAMSISQTATESMPVFAPYVGTLPANKAYFTASANAKVVAVFDENTTGITSYENDNDNEDENIYNLAGQRVSNTQANNITSSKRVYVQKGRKIVK